MAEVLPFKAIRPAEDKVTDVISYSFENYTSAELSAILAKNPYSFLQIIMAGATPNSPKLPAKDRFDRIKTTYKTFREQHYYQQEQTPCYYVYRKKNSQGVFTGIIAKTSTLDYKNTIIKKHEEIISSRKKNFAKYLKQVGFNAEPVLLTYPDNKDIESLVTKITSTSTTYDFMTENHEQHQLWTVDNLQIIEQLVIAFAKIPSLYIADGHHRCASSHELAQIMRQKTKGTNMQTTHDYFMSYLLPESQVKIHEFNRLITDLNNYTPSEILSEISKYYYIKKFEGEKQMLLHTNTEFSMYLEDTFYHLSLKKEAYTFNNVLSALAPQILNDTILEPILGITDVRKDPRIHFFYAKEALSTIKNHVDSGSYRIGFGMQPVSITALKNVADAALKMPPKSTYVVPKLPSGFLLYEF